MGKEMKVCLRSLIEVTGVWLVCVGLLYAFLASKGIIN